jgi:cell division protease FtsH
MPTPPLRHLVFWFVVLFTVPVILVVSKLASHRDVDQLIQSEFEDLLVAGRVEQVIVVEDPGSGIQTLTGTYWPENTDLNNASAKERFSVKVVYSEALDAMLRQYCNVRRADPSNNLLSNLLISLLPILLLVGLIYFLFSRQLRAAGKGALQFGKSRARMITPSQERVTLKDVCGIAEAKEEMQEIIEYLRDPGRFQKLGGRIPRGVLMVGPPGTGKTLLARAIAGEADVPFFSISGSDFVEMFVGVGASRVRDMFEEGKRHAPCLIFIDEIDAVGRSRFSGIGGGHDEREQTLNALLVEMDGFETNSGVIVIAATNRPDVLDPALLRPGRFDRQITIDLPDLKGRLGILKLHAKKVRLAPETDMRLIARGTPGFSGADLANLINEAALLAAREGKEAVDISDLEEARDKVRWGKERRSRKIDEKDRRVTAYHEAGHALVGVMCKEATPLHKITIIPRGVAYLGATMHLPLQDRYTKSKTELFDELAVLMGGRVAEQLIFQQVTSGAAMDIQQATGIAKKMVCQWGMSDKMGPLSYSGREEHIFLGRDITRSEDYSPETAREIDLEIRRIVDDAEERVETILTDNLDKLKALAETLLERETLAASEVYDVLGMEYTPGDLGEAFDDDLDDEDDDEDDTQGEADTGADPDEESDSGENDGNGVAPRPPAGAGSPEAPKPPPTD